MWFYGPLTLFIFSLENHNFIMETKIIICWDFVSQYDIIASLCLPKRSTHILGSIVLNIMNPKRQWNYSKVITILRPNDKSRKRKYGACYGLPYSERGKITSWNSSKKILEEKTKIFQFVQIVIKSRNLIDSLTKNIYKLVNYKMWKNVLWLYCMMQCIFIECVNKYFFPFQ